MAINLDASPFKPLRELHKRWPSKEESRAQFEEIMGASDRAAVILATTLLDDALLFRLLASYRRLSRSEYKRLFEAAGPLSTFSARIDIASAMSAFPMNIPDAFHVTRSLRNTAAHPRMPFSLERDEVRNVCTKLISLLPGASPENRIQTNAGDYKSRTLFLFAAYVLRGHLMIATAQHASGLTPHDWKGPAEQGSLQTEIIERTAARSK